MLTKNLLAQIGNPALKNPNSQSNPAFISNVFQNIFSIFLVLGVIYFVWHFIFAGYHFIASQGDPKQIESAKNEVTYAFVGLAIIFSVFAVLKFIGAVLGISGLDSLQITLPSL